MRRGYLTAAVLGALWMVVLSVTVAVTMSFATGGAFRPSISFSLLWGALVGMALILKGRARTMQLLMGSWLLISGLYGWGALQFGEAASPNASTIGTLALAAIFVVSLTKILEESPPAS